MDTVKSKPITWVELAKRLGYSRGAIYLWREMPDAPTETDLVQWQAFIEQHGLGKNSTKSLTELKGEVESEKLRKLRRENEIAEGQTIKVETVTDILSQLAAKLDLLLTQKIEVELPPLCVGQSIAEIRAKCRTQHDQIREITHAGLLNWKPSE
jgi:hypothetical protein